MDVISSIDIDILLFIQEHLRFPWLDWFWKSITFLGDAGWFWIVLSIILLIPKKTRHIAIASGISLLICFFVTNIILKNCFHRIRPYEIEPLLTILVKKPTDFSFPSGHTTASFASALILVRLFPKKFGIPSVVLAALIAFSRLYVGVHYPTDILGGIAVALIGSFIAITIYRKLIVPKFFPDLMLEPVATGNDTNKSAATNDN